MLAVLFGAGPAPRAGKVKHWNIGGSCSKKMFNVLAHLSLK
jgi:hypothetical protein